MGSTRPTKMDSKKEWVIKVQGKVVQLSNSMVEGIRTSPTKIIGWFNLDLMKAWKFIFPATQESIRDGSLPLSDPTWSNWPNPWWMFLTDRSTPIKRSSPIWKIMLHPYPLLTLCGLIPMVEVTETATVVDTPVIIKLGREHPSRETGFSFPPSKENQLDDGII